jgi:hypothetical protein
LETALIGKNSKRLLSQSTVISKTKTWRWKEIMMMNEPDAVTADGKKLSKK